MRLSYFFKTSSGTNFVQHQPLTQVFQCSFGFGSVFRDCSEQRHRLHSSSVTSSSKGFTARLPTSRWSDTIANIIVINTPINMRCLIGNHTDHGVTTADATNGFDEGRVPQFFRK